MMSTIERITAVLTGFVDAEKITPAVTAVDLGLDSLDQVEFVCELEEEFDLELDEGLLEGVATLQQLVDTIDKARAA